MIINGGSRCNGAFFARHLMRADENERVTVADMRGFAYAEDVPSAFRELADFASGTRCKNFFYHSNLNARADEHLTPEQWAQVVDSLERGLHLEGQPRFIVEHEKEGRVHRHVVWGRIDPDSMTAISDSHNYRTHETVAADLETAFGHQATDRALTRDKEATERPEPNVKDWEQFRAAESKIDPKAIKAELTELWRHSDTGPAFAAALAERGYILARGDRRDFCVIDQAGDEHSLSRRLAGVKAAEVRDRMEGIDREALPSVAEARALARAQQDEPTGNTPVEALSPFDALMLKTVQDERAYRAQIERLAEASAPEMPEEAALTDFDICLAQTVRRAAQESIRAAQAERDAPGATFEQFRAWCGVLWGHLASWGETLREQFKDLLHPAPEPDRREESTPSRDMEPQL